MRYYVLLDGVSNRAARPYIVAETVSEPGDDGSDRDSSLAAVLAGPQARIVTEHELVDIAGGLEALVAWREDDDAGYGDATVALDKAEVAGEGSRSSSGRLATVTRLRPRRTRRPAGSV